MERRWFCEGITMIIFTKIQRFIENQKLNKKTKILFITTLLFIVGCSKPVEDSTLIKKDGLQTRWYDNGQKWLEENYKDGKEDGLTTEWYENGKKRSEVNYKDGKKDGLQTNWYENGQKSREVKFKDDNLVLIIGRWNEAGSVRND